MSKRTLEGLTPDEAISRAEQLIGYEFSDKDLLQAALTHPSAAMHTATTFNYERLEFLGDSILGAVVAEHLFRAFPDLEEGGLTRIKVTLVAGSMLSEVAREVGLGSCIIFGGSETADGRRGLHSALENVYEAVVAALYLDGGIDAARTWIASTVLPRASKDIAAEPENPKSSLQELLQAHGQRPEYEIVGEEGPAHQRVFFAQARVEGKVVGKGSGRSKKDAEAKAAAQALDTYEDWSGWKLP